MALYENLAGIDIIQAAMPAIDAGKYMICHDGKIRFTRPQGLDPRVPWIWARQAFDRNCHLWGRVYFDLYKMISRNCFNCWKIIAKPDTLEKLFKLQEVQKELNLPGKCGMELRPQAMYGGLWRGFWYASMADGLKGAKERCRKVGLKVKDALGVQTPVYLKRGCTEMEDRAGPSSEWDYPDEHNRTEDLLDATWELEVTKQGIPMVLQMHIHRLWVERAMEERDPTADKYYDNLQSFGIAPTVKYDDKEVELKSLPKFRLLEEKDEKAAETPRILTVP
jgi:hypothetical protein